MCINPYPHRHTPTPTRRLVLDLGANPNIFGEARDVRLKVGRTAAGKGSTLNPYRLTMGPAISPGGPNAQHPRDSLQQPRN